MMTSAIVARSGSETKKENPIPHNEEDLVAETTLLLVLKVEHSVSGVVLGECSNKVGVGGGLGSGLLNNDLGVIGVDGEDHIAVVLAELKLLELLDAIVGNLDARGLLRLASVPGAAQQLQTREEAVEHAPLLNRLTGHKRRARSLKPKSSPPYTTSGRLGGRRLGMPAEICGTPPDIIVSGSVPCCLSARTSK